MGDQLTNPDRKSWRDKLQEQDEGAAMAPASLTDLNVSELTDSFVFDRTGALISDVAAPLPMAVERTEARGELPLAAPAAHHLLATARTATGAEVEALAVSLWDGAKWTAPGRLHLTGGAWLEGPWTLPVERSRELGFPPGVELVWEVHCPPNRGPAPSREVAAFDRWARVFPDGLPMGVELEVVSALERIAKRLRAALRIAGSGAVISPDPEESVNLRLYSPEYLPAEVLWEALAPIFRGQVELQPSPEFRQVEEAAYAFICGDGASQILAAVHPVEHVPRALRWEPWTKQPFFCYDLQWLHIPVSAPAEPAPGSGPGSNEYRLRRQIAVKVEAACLAISRYLHTYCLLDEDDFLLALD